MRNIRKRMFRGVLGFSLFREIVPALGSFVFIIYVGYLAWMSLGPQKPVPDTPRQQAADAAVALMIEEIRNNRGNIRSAELLHFANDPTDYFSNSLRSALDRSGILNLEDRSLGEKIRNKLNLRNRGCFSLHEALKSVTADDVDGVLWGRLNRFESSDAGVILNGEWQLVNLKTGTCVYSGKLAIDTTSEAKETLVKNVRQIKTALQQNAGFFEYTARLLPWYIRFLGFVLLTLLLPIVTISFIRTMVAKRSNRINSFMLGIYTVLDAIFAFFMVGGAFCSIWAVFLFLIATALALFYNYALMNFALELES